MPTLFNLFLRLQGARDLSAKGQAAGLAAAERRRVMMIDARQPERVSRGQPTGSKRQGTDASSPSTGGGSIEEWLNSSAAKSFSSASPVKAQGGGAGLGGGGGIEEYLRSHGAASSAAMPSLEHQVEHALPCFDISYCLGTTCTLLTGGISHCR